MNHLRLTSVLALAAPCAFASSHMDAPLIVLDPAANTTDVYAFVTSAGSAKSLITALGVYPHEEPGVGPNKFNFDDRVVYGIHLAMGANLGTGKPSISYYFKFDTRYKTRKSILQSYTGVVKDVDDAAQNLTQTYAVYSVDYRAGGTGTTALGRGIVPPNNEGIATPEYNLLSGNGPAKDGVAIPAALDKYTAQTITQLQRSYCSFAGQREDGFYADINAVFDLLSLRPAAEAKDSQSGFNIHMMVLQIPLADIGGDQQVVGVWANTMRQQVCVRFNNQDPVEFGDYVQVARQGNPLFNEAFVAIEDKDIYSRTSPEQDAVLFDKYARTPELAKLLNATVFKNNPIPGIETLRTDLVGIFIPDVIKVDLSTSKARFAGGGPNHPTNPDDPGFHRLSVFGGDTLFSSLQNQMIPGGWPNGRRFGDDVLDIGVSAVISDLRVTPPTIRIAGDNVDKNDSVYSKVMPYAGTPHNGRVHTHNN